MSTGSNKGGIQSDINVTPLIDVLLVLLIIFLVVMPIMMKMETLEIPRKLDEATETSDSSIMLVVKVKASGDMVLSDNDKEQSIQAADLLRTLRPRLEQAVAHAQDRVVFVEFEETCNWGQVVTTMDSIRALATDVNHDEVKVALKLKEDLKPQ
ncbi:MAG TPA: biopolymer transporter ExbD [Kofleriaceae bacterium]